MGSIKNNTTQKVANQPFKMNGKNVVKIQPDGNTSKVATFETRFVSLVDDQSPDSVHVTHGKVSGTFYKRGYVFNYSGNGHRYHQSVGGSPFDLVYLKQSGVGYEKNIFPTSFLDDGSKIKMSFVIGSVHGYINLDASRRNNGIQLVTVEFWKAAGGYAYKVVKSRPYRGYWSGYPAAVRPPIGSLQPLDNSWNTLGTFHYNLANSYWARIFFRVYNGQVQIAQQCDWRARDEFGLFAILFYDLIPKPPMRPHSAKGTWLSETHKQFFLNKFTTEIHDEIKSEFIITELNAAQVTTIGPDAFKSCVSLEKVDFINLETVGEGAFYQKKITTAIFPELKNIGRYAFKSCGKLKQIYIPKATTIGNEAFLGVHKEAEVWMNRKFNTDAEKDRIFGKNGIYFSGGWKDITFHWFYDDGYPALDSSKLGHTGEFITIEKLLDFYSYDIFHFVHAAGGSFRDQGLLTGISIPYLKRILPHAFSGCPLRTIHVPHAINIGDGAFDGFVHDFLQDAEITMNHKFNTDAEKARIFGPRWNTVGSLASNVIFNWTNDDGSLYDPNSWRYGDGSNNPHPTQNDWKGNFSDSSQQNRFAFLSDRVPNAAFDNERALTAISLPKATNIGQYSFRRAPLTAINIPEATYIGYSAFEGIVNTNSTTVMWNYRLEIKATKVLVFGGSHWENVKFRLYDDLGVLVPEVVKFTDDYQHLSSGTINLPISGIQATVGHVEHLFVNIDELRKGGSHYLYINTGLIYVQEGGNAVTCADITQPYLKIQYTRKTHSFGYYWKLISQTDHYVI